MHSFILYVPISYTFCGQFGIGSFIESFFWEGKEGSKINHLVRWNFTYQDQSNGELGIGALKHRNLALISKQGWRSIQEPHSVWREVIGSIHGSQVFGWHKCDSNNFSLRSPWTSISKTWRKFEKLALFTLGNEQRTHFWIDHWINNYPLRFPRLFALSLNQGGSDSSTLSWNFSFRC